MTTQPAAKPKSTQPSTATVVVVVVGFIVLMGGVLLGAGTPTKSATAPAAPATTASSPAVTTAPAAEPAAAPVAPAVVPAVVPAKPAATAVPQPTPGPIGSRANPIPLGQALIFRRDGRTYEVKVTNVIRNASAEVKRINQFNSPPTAGHEYVLVQISLKYLDGSKTEPWKTTNGNHRLSAGNRLWGAPSFIVGKDPAASGQEIFPGATVTGWLDPREVPAEFVGDAQLVYEDAYFKLS